MESNFEAVLSAMNEIRSTITSESYRQELPTVIEWGGAGLIVSAVEINREGLEGKVIVVTEYSRELSWLVYQLRDACAPVIDYLTKYSFYPPLGRRAIAYLSTTVPHGVDGLLVSVLDEAAAFVLES